MRSAPLLLLVALLASLYAVPAPAATTADRARARQLFREAQQHYKLAEYPQALDGFKEVYRILEDPSLLFNLAQCYRQLNRKEDAIRFYRTYLHDATDVADRDSVEQIVAGLEKALRDEQTARAAPPQSTIETPATVAPTTTPAPVTPAPELTAAPAPPAPQPVYKRWWLWTTVVGVAAVGVGVGLGVGLTHTPAGPSASTQDGTFHPF